MLLRRLSVFAAGYETDGVVPQRNGVELPAVIAVCADGILPAERVAPLLERLAERSLVSTFRTETTVRWYLVESVRLFAGDRLRRGPAEAARPAAPPSVRVTSRGDPAALGAAAAIRIRATELAWLVGVFRACHRSMGVCIERVPMVVLGVHRATEVATAVIGPADFAVAEQRGGQFRPGSDAVREYLRRRWPVRPLAVDTPVDHGGSADSRWGSLSPAEREVAVLAAAGWPNSAIA
ncbi:hypothetical protein [Nocardia sp. NPDC002869]|uniref:hypothetical protein n=1 Tax=Nocardia sp. NPDC002869 TaxID=3161032 RepID=UPI00398D4809